MKKYLFLVVLCLLLGAVYLNRAYARIYSTIGSTPLFPPRLEEKHHVGTGTTTLSYVALGDSLTAGVGVESATQTFPHALSAKIAIESGSTVILTNLGRPGATAHDLITDQLPKALFLKPQIATILIGVNDVHNRTPLGLFTNDIRSVVAALVKNGTHVYISTIPLIGSDSLFLPPLNLYFSWQTDRYSLALKKALQGSDAHLVPLQLQTNMPIWRSNKLYSGDTFHPNEDGYLTWAHLFYDSIYR